MLRFERFCLEFQVNNWGTFDVANYGDLLFPLILESELKKRLSAIQVKLSSPNGGWFYPQKTRWVERIPRLEDPGFFSETAKCQAIILGGGDIIRFDDRAMTHIYGISEEQADKERSYSVFIEDLGQIAQWVPVLWNAVGIPFEFNEQQSLVLRESLCNVLYISVRDELSKKKLVDAGIKQEINVVPDTAFLVSRHYPKESLAELKEVLVKANQFPANGKVLCFQVSAAAITYINEITDALNKLLKIDSEIEIVFLPIGICHADTPVLKSVQKQINKRTFLVHETTELQIIAAVIAYSDYFAGSSLHGNITAYAYGTPHLFLDFFNLAKIQGAAIIMGSEQRLITQVDMLLPALSQLIQQSRNWDRPLAQLVRQIDSHFDRYVELLQQQSNQVLPSEVVINFVEKSQQSLRQALRERPTKLQQIQAELEGVQAQLQQTQTELQQLQSLMQQVQVESERSQSQLQQTQTELERSQSQLQQTQTELERSQSQLQQTQAELERSQSQLQQTQTELERSQARTHQAQAETERAQSQLQQTQTELKRSQATITGMESSKFWKLRTAWFRFKQAFGLTDSSKADTSVSSPQTPDSQNNSAIPEVINLREINFKPVSRNLPNGFFDGINGSATTIKEPTANAITASGWAILADEGRPADKVIITYGNNTLVAVVPVNLERLDVVAVLDNPAYRYSGWSITIDPATLPVGKVLLKAWAYNSVRKEAIQLNYPTSRSQLSRSVARIKHIYTVLKVKGIRYALAKVSQKIYQKLNDSPRSLEVIPTVSSIDSTYQKWLSKNFPREADLRKMAETVEVFSYRPVISVIMPVYNPPERFLREAIESVVNQVYPYWELCIADDTSTKSYVKQTLQEYAAKDQRIKVVFRSENGHISRASNSAIELATGEFIALLDHDDLLTPDALYEVALLLNRHPEADMIYSDEDKIDECDQRREPFFKPDWCPDSFLSRMYTCHLGTYRRSLVNEIGGFRVGLEGSQDYDLVLRFTEKTKNIFHIPKILYSWRVHSQSTASGSEAKPYAYIAAEKALFEALNRRGEKGRISGVPGFLGLYSVRYEIEDYKLVSIIIPTKDLGETLNKCLKSIFEKSVYPNFEVVVIDNGSKEDYTAKVIKNWETKEPNRFRSYKLDVPFNFSKINNYAVTQTKGEYLLFLNNDIEVISPDWIDAMVEQAQRPSIGAVGALLLYPDKYIQHAGVVLGIGGVASHSHKKSPSVFPGYFGQAITINNYSAVTAACLMCRREVYESAGGFEEELAVAYNDIDFCLKLVEQGLRNIYLPHVVLYHYESKSRGSEDKPEKLTRLIKEAEYMQNKWKQLLENDPCYSLHLTKDRDDYSIKS